MGLILEVNSLREEVIHNDTRRSAVNYLTAVDFLRTALANNHPVALLVTSNTYVETLPHAVMAEMHFVTITGVNQLKLKEETRNEVDGAIISAKVIDEHYDYELIISNYGRRQVIPSLKKLWEGQWGTKAAADNIPLGADVVGNFLPSVSLARWQFR